MTILKSIPRIINPRLLYTLARMGHGDELVLADANFPSASVAAHTTLREEIRVDGNSIPELLKAIMTLMPLDDTVPPCVLMGMMPEHKAAGWKTPIWDTYKAVVAEGNGAAVAFEEVERFAFYERAKKAFAVVATG
jgi:L-fucose mutarotase